jgi:hypothetical protein
LAKAPKVAKAEEVAKIPASEAAEAAEGRDVFLLQKGLVTRSGVICLVLNILCS